MAVSLTQQESLPTRAIIDRARHWIVVSRKGLRTAGWQKLPYGAALRERVRRLPKDMRDAPQQFQLGNRSATVVTHAACTADIGAFALLTLARKLVATQWPMQPKDIVVTPVGFEADVAERIAEAVLAALLAAAAPMPNFKSEPPASGFLRRVRIYGAHQADRYRRTFAEAEGNALARELATLPPNELTPGSYRERIATLAKTHGWTLEFIDTAALKRRKAGAFLSVVRGSPVADAGIAHVTYKPARRAGDKVALVGKGICYDTGGVNLKPAKFMLGMQGDMQGSAVALGTLLALSRLEVPFQVDAWLALATNHIGSKAYTPNEIVRAADGTSIEVIHTDAEGRMVLADTLYFASRAKPDLIIDYATLTGACVYSLGTAYTGVFSNRNDWTMRLIETGRQCGERVWAFPMDEDYDEQISSNIADVKQCSSEGGADHILAARFLQRFVKNDIPWVHLDLSAGDRKGGLAHVPTEFTGFGVRYTTALLLDQELMAAD